jgi:hypothetical protein
LIGVLCGVPPVAATDAAGPAVLVRAKLACAGTPNTEAVTMYVPALIPAVIEADVATPEALVVAVFTPPANAPLGPVEGTPNITAAPATGLPLESFTVTTSGAENGVFTAVLCGVPLVATIDAGVAAVFAKENVAEFGMPVAEAVTT